MGGLKKCPLGNREREQGRPCDTMIREGGSICFVSCCVYILGGCWLLGCSVAWLDFAGRVSLTKPLQALFKIIEAERERKVTLFLVVTADWSYIAVYSSCTSTRANDIKRNDPNLLGAFYNGHSIFGRQVFVIFSREYCHGMPTVSCCVCKNQS